SGSTGAGESVYAACQVVPMGATETRYHVVLDVEDRPGVLASVAQLFADEGVSIETLQQDGRGDEARLVVVTHSAPDSVLRHTVGSLAALESVHAVTSVLRVEGLT
ncbi:MAG: homoserine dehydrogenase, partial [Nocardioidaceae bacterium]|nr:homoserine dehydrogenase [Nocardioidaceae bacterium]